MRSLDITMPILRPVRIQTEGLSWWKKLLVHFKRRNWELMEDYCLYLPSLNEILFIPKGFIFDGASVPTLLWPLMNPTGILLIGSLFHDFGYRYNCFLNGTGRIVHEGAGQKFFDKQIKDISIYVNGIHSMSTIAWAMLRAFGFFAWNDNRKEGLDVKSDFADVVVLN